MISCLQCNLVIILGLKTPLNARVTGILERDTYVIEKIIFESRLGLAVTANLYLPKGRKFPLPAVVGTCGHSDNGKANPLYQSFAQGLARFGYPGVLKSFDLPDCCKALAGKNLYQTEPRNAMAGKAF